MGYGAFHVNYTQGSDITSQIFGIVLVLKIRSVKFKGWEPPKLFLLPPKFGGIA